jgi:SOS response associated peptidase (SRAP)
VPFTSFSEYKDTKPRKTPVRFALNKDRPLAAFAGIWRPWTGVRGTKAEPVEGEHLLYSFLTSEPNGIVGPIHPKAMPVILTTPEEYETWLSAPRLSSCSGRCLMTCSRLWPKVQGRINLRKAVEPNPNQPMRWSERSSTDTESIFTLLPESAAAVGLN